MLVLLAGTIWLSGCAGIGASSGIAEPDPTLSGNWQFTMAPQIGSDGQTEFLGGLDGGFMLQNSGTAATGNAEYAVLPPGLPYPCNSGSAAITGTSTGTMNGQSVWVLTAVAGTQTFTLTGTLSNVVSKDGVIIGKTMTGTYTSTPGTAPDGSVCGAAESGLQWSAVLVPPMTGGIQGSFHSTGGGSGLTNQDFVVTGSLVQAANTGAASATVTGKISFQTDPLTGTSAYPCLASASVYGAISGNLVALQIVDSGGSVIGAIGEPAGANGATGISPVTFDPANSGYVLHGVGPSYLVATSSCPGSTGSITTAGDYGNLCLGMGASGCQTITLTPDQLIFLPQMSGTTSSQPLALENTSGGSLNGVTLAFANVPASASNFIETDDCGTGGMQSQPGVPFDLGAVQSCVLTITFVPECTDDCGTMNATVTITTPYSADRDTVFIMPISGVGTSQ